MLRPVVPNRAPGHAVDGGRFRVGLVVRDHGVRPSRLERPRQALHCAGHAPIARDCARVVLDDLQRGSAVDAPPTIVGRAISTCFGGKGQSRPSTSKVGPNRERLALAGRRE